MILNIKNMVCDRCKKSVAEDLEQLSFQISNIDLGRVEIVNTPTESELEILKSTLKNAGFELLDDPQLQLIERIKNAVIKHVHHQKEKPEAQNFSAFLVKETGVGYSTLSKLFSGKEGQTIEHFIIAQKIERAKELLIYNEKTLSEIAWELNYSSVQHLSAQFKNITGITPSKFKKQPVNSRVELDQL